MRQAFVARAFLCWLAAVGSIAGCAGGPGRDAIREAMHRAVAREDVPCLATMERTDGKLRVNQGSGTRISATRVVTCSHVWPEGVLLASADGELAGLWKLVERGRGPGSTNDWLVLETEPGRPSGFVMDEEFRPREGDEVVIAGYLGSERIEEFPEQTEPSLRLIDGWVIAVPAELVKASEGVVFIRAERDDIKGVSGGPALAWDAKRQRAVLIGIVVETVSVWRDDVVIDRVHAIRTLSFLKGRKREEKGVRAEHPRGAP